MDSTINFESSRQAHTASAGEVKDSTAHFLRSELRLAAAEIRHTTGHFKAQSTTLLVASGAALLGLMPFMAFLVMGLGYLWITGNTGTRGRHKVPIGSKAVFGLGKDRVEYLH